MNKLLWILPLLLLLVGCTSNDPATAGGAPRSLAPVGRGPLVHMVAFKFKDTASPQQLEEVRAGFAALPSQIPQVASFESGTNISPEGLSKGFTDGFILTFWNTQDRDAYLVSPAHKKFVEVVSPVLAEGGAFVIDFWSR